MVRSSAWSYRFYRWLWSGLDWVYPPVCGGCGKVGFHWCPDCQVSAVFLSEPVCNICGCPQAASGVCSSCHAESPSYRILRSCFAFEGSLRKLIHGLKYRRDLGLGDTLAKIMVDYASSLGWPIDLVIPVPLGERRLKERGYNQVALIARPLAMAMDWNYTPGALVRVRETASQVGLSVEERRENVHDAFRASPARVHGKNVLLLDDVATTGSTLSSCACALLTAGTKEVYALTVARALPKYGYKDA